MTIEAAAVIPEPAPAPSLEVVPDPPVEVTIAEIAAGVTSALVEAWNAVRARHPDVPEAVISMATGGRASAVELAHFAPRRWRLREGDGLHHEVFVTAESLADGAQKVFGYLLHEATHAANEARGVNDCSASQYHNKHFRKTAEELGLIQRDVTEKWKKKYGFAGTELGEEAARTYADQITALDKAIHATRTPEIFGTRTRGGSGSTGGTADDAEAGADAGEDGEAPTGKKEKEDRNYVKAQCQCTPPAVIRVSPRTLSRRRIMCGECEEDFALEESD
ncbi:hypothetical protein M1P56_35620 (plasmid) [Streptomyces sp. HU2014]|uniref:hypothetical protein n=1 Tax=Streptomyces sp. HU2014 TaxID=2939414 RepID=UPI00200E9AB4|nr:hypothetical protein [Streptomyces sp. HU2014]UQI49821.1 hypothetical protein M1P56_35620 [Streptomyces sp. HU2014]